MKYFFSFSDIKHNYKLLINKALKYKINPLLEKNKGKNKIIGLIFFNPSLRTRLSSIKAAYNLNAKVWILNINSESWKIETEDGVIMNGTNQEHIKDAIQVVNLYCDLLGVRTFPKLKNQQEDYKELIFNKIKKYSSIPLISLETATLHPLQSFADAITIEEFKKNKEKVKVVLTWVPHVRSLPQSVANSCNDWFSQIDDINLTIVHPKGYELNNKFIHKATILHNQDEALEGADFVYAKNWSSYNHYGEILSKDPSWKITKYKMSKTNNAKFMHCLPVRRNLIVDDDVLNSPNSIILQQAYNRIFAAQTIFSEMFKKNIN